MEEKIYRLLGCVYYGNPFHSFKGWDPKNEIGNTWSRFQAIRSKYSEFLDKIRLGNAFGFEVHIEPDDYNTQKKFHIFVCLEVKSLDFFPLEMFYKELPKTKYLFFTTKYKEGRADYYFSKWLPNSDYEASYPYIMQSYSPERWDINDQENSLMDWFVPIKKKEEKSNDN